VRVRTIAFLALAVGGLLAATAPPASATPQDAGVQVALRALGFYCGPIDGIRGPLTAAALRTAQQRAGLPPTGAPDARTRRALGPLGAPRFGTRVLRAGRFGLDVAVLQFLLARAGSYDGALDGYLGPRTRAAVLRFQRTAGLAADGIVGPRTRTALLARRAPSRQPETYVVRPGDSLTAIAGRFGVTVARVARANAIERPDLVVVGARLRIPAARTAASLDATPETVRERLTAWAGRLGVAGSLVRALAWMESGYQPRIVSEAGAEGVLQLLPSTRRFAEEVLAGRLLPRTLDGDIEAGVLHLRHLLGEFGGDRRLALAAWYQGARAVREHGVYPESETFAANVLALASRM
jgi:peptidoglycan hydrolase-like protein with peptidoglycan-binding domain